MRTGIANLTLDQGKCPPWLFERMKKLAELISLIIIEEFGTQEFLKRLSDPVWFQSFGALLAFDWNASGLTTTTLAALKEALRPYQKKLGIFICGGKGKTSRKTPQEIENLSFLADFDQKTTQKLIFISRAVAKIDNCLLQDGFQLYHHSFLFDKSGNWCVIQQGMNTVDRTARRYHWISGECKNFVVEPHKAIVGDKMREKVLNLTSKDSDGCRNLITDLAKEDPKRTFKMLKSVRPKYQSSLEGWLFNRETQHQIDYLRLPARVNWRALRKAYESQVKSFEELISIQGVGPATIRGLTIVSELVYGEKPSWRDPIKYSFAFGGKDGVPFPVDKRAMDEAITFLEEAVKNAKLRDKEKLRILKRLNKMVSSRSRWS